MITKMEVHHLEDLWHRGSRLFLKYGKTVETRNGPAWEIPGQVLITFERPRERVLLDRDRNCNHVFHLMESIWMLAGRNDTAFPAQFNSNISNYSDDGSTFHGAYGHRWRSHFGVDQVEYAIDALMRDPNDRRVVIDMWDGEVDGNGITGKDFPCNVMILPKVVDYRTGPHHERGPKLDITIINRSNDFVWGLCGANAVHMSILHEYMANSMGLRVGRWHHFTNNLHVYEKHWDLVKDVAEKENHPWAPYCNVSSVDGGNRIGPMVQDRTTFLRECREICAGKTEGFEEPFLENTVEPVWASWRAYKAGDLDEAQEIAECIDQFDWRKGVMQQYAIIREKRESK
jgi:thymidylate synthase